MDGCPDGDGDEPEPEEDVDLFVDDVVGQHTQPILVLNRAGGTVLAKKSRKKYVTNINTIPKRVQFQALSKISHHIARVDYTQVPL